MLASWYVTTSLTENSFSYKSVNLKRAPSEQQAGARCGGRRRGVGAEKGRNGGQARRERDAPGLRRPSTPGKRSLDEWASPFYARHCRF